MSTANLNINPDQTGLAYTSDLNDALSALDSAHSGSTAPTDQLATGKFWLNTAGTDPILNIYRSGTVDPWKPLFTIGAAGVSTSLTALNVSGTITATDFNTTSDNRLKTNINNLNEKDSLEKVCKLQGVSYTINEKPSVGLIAQDTKEIIPEVVLEREDGYLGINYSNLVAYLVEAIKAQEKRILILENEIKTIRESQ